MAWFTAENGLEVFVLTGPSKDGFYVKQPCEKCGRLFRTSSALASHMATYHTKDQPNDQ